MTLLTSKINEYLNAVRVRGKGDSPAEGGTPSGKTLGFPYGEKKSNKTYLFDAILVAVRFFRRGCSSMVEYELPKLGTTVRFRSPAPFCFAQSFSGLSFVGMTGICMALLLSGCATAPHRMVAETVTKPVIISNYPVSGLKNEAFSWPLRGYIITSFGINNASRSKGIDIRANNGAAVRAAKSGRVVYCDPHMKGMGNTIIIDHGGGLQTVYAYNSAILVNVGDAVERGSVIAKAGATGRAKEPSLHFEVRKNGEPQNPSYYLP